MLTVQRPNCSSTIKYTNHLSPLNRFAILVFSVFSETFPFIFVVKTYQAFSFIYFQMLLPESTDFLFLIQLWYVPSWWIRHLVATWINMCRQHLAAREKAANQPDIRRQALKTHEESDLEVRLPSRFTWGCASHSLVFLGMSHVAKKTSI